MRLTKHLRSKLLNIVIIVLAAVGVFDAALLTKEHYAGTFLPCTITKGCDVVLSSKYSEVFGIPLALFGVVFYIAVLTLALVYFYNQTIIAKRVLLLLGSIGFASSLVLVYIQGAVLRAWCQYCLLSALTSTLIFVSVVVLNLMKEKQNNAKS